MTKERDRHSRGPSALSSESPHFCENDKEASLLLCEYSEWGNINSEFCLLFHRTSRDGHRFESPSWPESVCPLGRVHTSKNFDILEVLLSLVRPARPARNGDHMGRSGRNGTSTQQAPHGGWHRAPWSPSRWSSYFLLLQESSKIPVGLTTWSVDSHRWPLALYPDLLLISILMPEYLYGLCHSLISA